MDPEKYAPESAVPRRNYICLTVKDQMNKIELLFVDLGEKFILL